MLAKEHKVPVVACVETYKFGERVVLDGVASNELGDAQVLFDIPANKAVGVKKPVNQALTPLCLMYDLTPPNLITAVCTEVSFLFIPKLQLISDRLHPTQFGTNCFGESQWCGCLIRYIALYHYISLM